MKAFVSVLFLLSLFAACEQGREFSVPEEATPEASASLVLVPLNECLDACGDTAGSWYCVRNSRLEREAAFCVQYVSPEDQAGSLPEDECAIDSDCGYGSLCLMSTRTHLSVCVWAPDLVVEEPTEVPIEDQDWLTIECLGACVVDVWRVTDQGFTDIPLTPEGYFLSQFYFKGPLRYVPMVGDFIKVKAVTIDPGKYLEVSVWSADMTLLEDSKNVDLGPNAQINHADLFGMTSVGISYGFTVIAKF